MNVQFLHRSHPARSEAESMVRSVYWHYYGATPSGFPPLMLAVVGGDGTMLCVAGLRTEEAGFFSEAYLDKPVENALSAEVREPVSRDKILEVTTLACAHPGNASHLVNFILSHAAEQQIRWGLFTATRQLRCLFRRRSLDLIELEIARRDRLQDADAWGSYYDSDPVVCALSVPPLDAHMAQQHVYSGREAALSAVPLEPVVA